NKVKSVLPAHSDGPSSLEIDGVDVVTVGIPYGFQCTAECYPDCRYSWTRGNKSTQGPELSLQLLQIVPTQSLTCTVVNPETGRSASVQKTLQVTAGPSNIQISGPAFLMYGVASIFTCSADCYPSCSYSWTIVWEKEPINTAQGNTIPVTPAASTVLSESLICKAQDTISDLYISTTVSLPVAITSDISIIGDSTVTMGKQYLFICQAVCVPTCNFVWQYMGTTLYGDQVQIPILHQGEKTKFASHLQITFSDYSKIEPLTCEATNVLTNTTISSTIDLSVIGSITWLKNKQPMAASERVLFSPDNTTVTFSPLLQADEDGPSSVGISGLDVMTVGITYDFQCSASCHPTCQFTWTRGNVTYQGSNLSLHFEEQLPTQNLTCTALNPATGISVTAQKTLLVIAGPSNIQISGPAFLTAGVASNFTCSADCYPSCSYSWIFDREWEPFSTTQGNTISVTPPAGFVGSDTLICLFNINIAGASAVAIGKMYTYTCYATCTPSCVFTWTFMGKTYEGDQLQITISDYSKTGTLTCEATNNMSHATISATKNLTVIDPFSVRPGSQALPVADGPDEVLIVKPDKESVGEMMFTQPGSTTELQCLTDCFPACSINWFYRGSLLATNASILFTPVTPPYENPLTCMALNPATKKNRTAETTVVVPDGPRNVIIKGPYTLEIGVTASFTCSAECTPSCRFKWTLYGKTVTGSGIDITVNRQVSEETISCQAENTFTGKTVAVKRTLSVSGRLEILTGVDVKTRLEEHTSTTFSQIANALSTV
ncbi:hypothetical protein FQN60_005525, partial [Etheostoma spectabile]